MRADIVKCIERACAKKTFSSKTNVKSVWLRIRIYTYAYSVSVLICFLFKVGNYRWHFIIIFSWGFIILFANKAEIFFREGTNFHAYLKFVRKGQIKRNINYLLGISLKSIWVYKGMHSLFFCKMKTKFKSHSFWKTVYSNFDLNNLLKQKSYVFRNDIF